MRTFSRWVMALVASVLWLATAPAQEDIIHPDASTIQMLLLRQKSVQKELNLSPEVTRKAMDFTSAQSEAAGKAHEMEPAERKKAFEELEAKNREFLSETLTAKQKKRLHQIALQVTALHQLTKPEAIRELKLTEEQQEKLQQLKKEARAEMQELHKSTETHAKTEKLVKLREKTREKILDLLTDEQKARVREIVGAPFTGELRFEEHEEKK